MKVVDENLILNSSIGNLKFVLDKFEGSTLVTLHLVLYKKKLT